MPATASDVPTTTAGVTRSPRKITAGRGDHAEHGQAHQRPGAGRA